MMEIYPWWSEKQKKLAEEAKKFADENIPWTREFPSDLIKEVAERGWFGASIPEDYGGLDTGVTGCCIMAEEIGRI